MKLGLSLSAALLCASPAVAQDYFAFQTPSGNIGCAIYAGELRCDIRDATLTIRRPPGCRQPNGLATVMHAYGSAYTICEMDSVLDNSAWVLQYGQEIEYGPFWCISERVGLTCRNYDGGGIFLSRAAQETF